MLQFFREMGMLSTVLKEAGGEPEDTWVRYLGGEKSQGRALNLGHNQLFSIKESSVSLS